MVVGTIHASVQRRVRFYMGKVRTSILISYLALTQCMNYNVWVIPYGGQTGLKFKVKELSKGAMVAGLMNSIFCLILIAKSMEEMLDLSVTNYHQQWSMVLSSGQNRDTVARIPPPNYSSIEKEYRQDQTAL